ncbi:MAG: hypothetical protein ACRDPV_10480 [Gaiellaceae bacterium]
MNARILVGLCFAALALAVATAATAAKPQITDINRELQSLGVDPFLSEECGFDVDVLNEARIRIIEFSDGTAQSHHHETYYWRANGKSLTEPVNFTIAFGEDETETYRGTVFNLVVPGAGPVLKEAGLAVFARDGSIVRLAGLHQVLDETSNPGAICDYLTG